jgi:predicted nucleic-acid-binding protein
MTGLDSNVLIRFFVGDDPEQAGIATQLIYSLTKENPGWVSHPVLVEVVWTLRRIYRMERNEIAAILDRLLASREMAIERRELVFEALDGYRTTRADFADCLIAASARAAGCGRVVTFDRVAARDAGMELLT